ncbi:MAG: hypothetical protein H7Y27_00690 [Gemmatimonadaceae bacterium]|nr:hypothetical protein [Chitinophagaceae bacterium]
MKTLNIRTVAAFLFVTMITLASCSKKKDDVVVPPSPMEGTWVGKWGFNNAVPANHFVLVIKNDGTLTVKEGNAINPNVGTGTWTLSESTFKATYSYTDSKDSKLALAAKLSDDKTQLAGSWGEVDVIGSGNILLSKQ